MQAAVLASTSAYWLRHTAMKSRRRGTGSAGEGSKNGSAGYFTFVKPQQTPAHGARRCRISMLADGSTASEVRTASMASMSIWKRRPSTCRRSKSAIARQRGVARVGRHHFVHLAMRHSTGLPLSADLGGRSTRQFLRLFDYHVFLGGNYLALAKAQHQCPRVTTVLFGSMPNGMDVSAIDIRISHE